MVAGFLSGHNRVLASFPSVGLGYVIYLLRAPSDGALQLATLGFRVVIGSVSQIRVQISNILELVTRDHYFT
jgi:hypothetical protein